VNAIVVYATHPKLPGAAMHRDHHDTVWVAIFAGFAAQQQIHAFAACSLSSKPLYDYYLT
jgi:hypothetical protein